MATNDTSKFSVYGHSGKYNSLIDNMAAKRQSLGSIVTALTDAKGNKPPKRAMLGHINDHAVFLTNTSEMVRRVDKVTTTKAQQQALLKKAKATGTWLLAELTKYHKAQAQAKKANVAKRSATKAGSKAAQKTKAATKAAGSKAGQQAQASK